MAAGARAVGGDIRDGRSECSVLLLIVGLAVLREGSETVLFLYGIAVAGNNGSSMMFGGMIGMLLGIAVGYLVYAGLLRMPLRWFFTARLDARNHELTRCREFWIHSGSCRSPSPGG